MNKLITKIVLSTLLLNSIPLYIESIPSIDSTKNFITNSYNTVTSSLSTSKGYRIAAAIVSAFSALLLGRYIIQKCSEAPQRRFQYLSTEEFTLLTQQLIPSIDAHLKPLTALIEQIEEKSSDLQEYEDLRNQLYELFYSSKIINTQNLCNELLEEVRTRENNHNSELEFITSLKATLNRQLKILETARRVSTPLVSTNNVEEENLYQSNYCSQHNPYDAWYHNDYWYRNNYGFQDITTIGIPGIPTIGIQNTENNKQTLSNPALMDTIKNINSNDILLSSFS